MLYTVGKIFSPFIDFGGLALWPMLANEMFLTMTWDLKCTCVVSSGLWYYCHILWRDYVPGNIGGKRLCNIEGRSEPCNAAMPRQLQPFCRSHRRNKCFHFKPKLWMVGYATL
jgi:hypothetical protein